MTTDPYPGGVNDWTEIATADELVALLGEPGERARDKCRPALLEVDRDWLAASPVLRDGDRGRRRRPATPPPRAIRPAPWCT